MARGQLYINAKTNKFMDPISILSLLNTASSLITGQSLTSKVAQGVESLLGGGTGENQQNFANILDSTKSSLNVTPQGGIFGLNAEGAASLIPANAGEVVTKETLASLNEILGNTDETDVLAETDATNAGGLLNTQKLDDPFGIKAAEANGSFLAAPNPLTNAQSNNIVNEEGEVVEDLVSSIKTSASSAANPEATTEEAVAVDPKSITKQGAVPTDSKLDDKEKLFKLGDKTTTEQKFDVANSNISEKIAQAKADTKNVIAERTAENKPAITSGTQDANPTTAAFMNRDVDTRTIGDAARAVRSRDEAREKLSEIDTYKVVSVSKRDNVIDLRLEPGQLGKVQIKFDFTDGKTNIAVIADRPETLDLLQKDTKSIQKILTDNGIQNDSSSMSFNLRDQQQQQHNNFNFFSGKPLSFKVEQEIQAANTETNRGAANYAEASLNGLLNILV